MMLTAVRQQISQARARRRLGERPSNDGQRHCAIGATGLPVEVVVVELLDLVAVGIFEQLAPRLAETVLRRGEIAADGGELAAQPIREGERQTVAAALGQGLELASRRFRRRELAGLERVVRPIGVWSTITTSSIISAPTSARCAPGASVGLPLARSRPSSAAQISSTRLAETPWTSWSTWLVAMRSPDCSTC